MLALLIKFAVLLAAIAVLWKVAGVALKGLVNIITVAAVTAVMAPVAYAAASAEKALPKRDLAFDFVGNRDDARSFNAIVRDRLRRTQMLATHPNLTMIATRIGRCLAGA